MKSWKIILRFFCEFICDYIGVQHRSVHSNVPPYWSTCFTERARRYKSLHVVSYLKSSLQIEPTCSCLGWHWGSGVKPSRFYFYPYGWHVWIKIFLGSVHDTGSLVSIPSIQTESTYQSAYGRPPSVNSFGSPSINGTFEQPSHDRRYNDGRKRFCLHFCMQ